MKENKLTFESQNLVVDYIRFNIEGLIDVKPIYNYLVKSFGFKSIIKKNEGLEMNYHNKNQLVVVFVSYEYDPKLNIFWSGWQINFPGLSGDYLYSLIKKNRLDWKILNGAILSRIDISYFRKSHYGDSNEQVKNFLESSYLNIRNKSKRQKVNFNPNKRPYLLKIGHRGSLNHDRVYQKSKEVDKGVYTENIDDLNFELEMKKDFIKPFHPVLLNNQIEEFETRLTQHFFKKSRQNFGFEFDYTDWIRDF